VAPRLERGAAHLAGRNQSEVTSLTRVPRSHAWFVFVLPVVVLFAAAAPAFAQPTNRYEAPSLTQTHPSFANQQMDARRLQLMPGGTIWAGTLISKFAGNWIDVDLTLPATMTAYEGSDPVRTMYTIIGRNLATPTGTFSIIRRVANETMDSSTVGIPRDGPGGYYLTNVLFTQYFLPTGESIHYNYWSSDFGYPDSHGCLGLSYDDAAFMWDFADIGTTVSIHY
jgi:lipoprotein-anchoring transpeptidase ErfK/SrfK